MSFRVGRLGACAGSCAAGARPGRAAGEAVLPHGPGQAACTLQQLAATVVMLGAATLSGGEGEGSAAGGGGGGGGAAPSPAEAAPWPGRRDGGGLSTGPSASAWRRFRVAAFLFQVRLARVGSAGHPPGPTGSGIPSRAAATVPRDWGRASPGGTAAP
jgi:hypothetical protein